MSVHLKSCPRCRGDLFIEYDVVLGKGWSCLQCGWRCEEAEVSGDYDVLLDEDGNMLKFERKRTSLCGKPVEKGEQE